MDSTKTTHGSILRYVIGFGLSLLLTIIPFSLVSMGTISGTVLVMVVIGFALVQLLVQLIFFLHMDSIRQWNTAAIVFACIIVCIVVVGSLWIMYNLDYNMMPKNEMDQLMIHESQKGF